MLLNGEEGKFRDNVSLDLNLVSSDQYPQAHRANYKTERNTKPSSSRGDWLLRVRPSTGPTEARQLLLDRKQAHTDTDEHNPTRVLVKGKVTRPHWSGGSPPEHPEQQAAGQAKRTNHRSQGTFPREQAINQAMYHRYIKAGHEEPSEQAATILFQVATQQCCRPTTTARRGWPNPMGDRRI